MLCINETTTVNHIDLQSIIDVVQNFGCKDCADLVLIRVYDSDELGVAGLAEYLPDNEVDHTFHSKITLWIPKTPIYPVQSTYRKAAGPARFDFLDEEIVHALAHEFCHVMQYRRCWGKGNKRHYEVEAELFAHRVLNRYRALKLELSLAETG